MTHLLPPVVNFLFLSIHQWPDGPWIMNGWSVKVHVFIMFILQPCVVFQAAPLVHLAWKHFVAGASCFHICWRQLERYPYLLSSCWANFTTQSYIRNQTKTSFSNSDDLIKVGQVRQVHSDAACMGPYQNWLHFKSCSPLMVSPNQSYF